MNDLPSRQWFRDHAGVMLNDTDEEGMEEWAVVAAYVSGRLVDREACQREMCQHPKDHHARSKRRCLHDCGCNVVLTIGDIE